MIPHLRMSDQLHPFPTPDMVGHVMGFNAVWWREWMLIFDAGRTDARSVLKRVYCEIPRITIMLAVLQSKGFNLPCLLETQYMLVIVYCFHAGYSLTVTRMGWAYM